MYNYLIWKRLKVILIGLKRMGNNEIYLGSFLINILKRITFNLKYDWYV